MKTFLLSIFLLIQIITSSQTAPRVYYLKAADKLEYQNYVKWCNDSIQIVTIQWGKATVINPNTLGLDYEMMKATSGNNVATSVDFRTIKAYSEEFGHLLKDTIWYDPWKPGMKTPNLSFSSNQVPLVKYVLTKVPRRKVSVPDFYANWKTGKIKR